MQPNQKRWYLNKIQKFRNINRNVEDEDDGMIWCCYMVIKPGVATYLEDFAIPLDLFPKINLLVDADWDLVYPETGEFGDLVIVDSNGEESVLYPCGDSDVLYIPFPFKDTKSFKEFADKVF